MKKLKIFFIAVALLICAFCVSCSQKAVTIPEKHTIPYPTGYDIYSSGASSFDSSGDHSDSPYFVHHDFYNMESTDTLTILTNYETYQQTTEYHCGPALAMTVLNHFGVTDTHELAIGEVMKTHQGADGGEPTEMTEMGTTVGGMVDFFNSLDWQVKSSLTDESPFDEYGEGFTDWVISELKAGTPVLVEWSDWAGHWQAIIGYDTMGTEGFSDDILIMADPYDTSDHWQDGYYIVNAQRFFYMWYDYNYQPENQTDRQWVIAKP
jgi:hypothetical protein